MKTLFALSEVPTQKLLDAKSQGGQTIPKAELVLNTSEPPAAAASTERDSRETGCSCPITARAAVRQAWVPPKPARTLLPGRAPTPGRCRGGGLATTRNELPKLQPEGVGPKSLCHNPWASCPQHLCVGSSKNQPTSNRDNMKPLTMARPHACPGQQTRHTHGTASRSPWKTPREVHGWMPTSPPARALPVTRGPTASGRGSSPPGKGRLRVGKGYSRAAEPGL